MILAGITLFAAAICWLIAVVSWIAALQHLKPEVSIVSMLFNGIKAFDSDNFTADGQVHHARFLKAFGVFFLALFLGAPLAVIGQQL